MNGEDIKNIIDLRLEMYDLKEKVKINKSDLKHKKTALKSYTYMMIVFSTIITIFLLAMSKLFDFDPFIVGFSIFMILIVSLGTFGGIFDLKSQVKETKSTIQEYKNRIETLENEWILTIQGTIQSNVNEVD